MTRRSMMAVLLALAATSVPLAARADGVTVVRGQFTDRVERSRPAGDAASLAGARTAIYWLELSNATGEPTEVTLVWVVDGRDVQRQRLTVHRHRVMRTWAFRRVGRAQRLGVRVLDAAGATLHQDETTLAAR